MVALGRDTAQLGRDQSGERLVRSLGHAQPDRSQLVGARGTVRRPELSAFRVLAHRGQVGGLVRVVFVLYLTDDLFDDVLQRHDARRASVLVDDDGHGVAAGQPVEESVDRQGLRYQQGFAQQLGDRVPGPALGRYGQDVLDVRDSDDPVEAAPVDGEARQTGGAGGVGDVLHRGLHIQRHDPYPGGHHVLRGQLGQAQCPYEQFGGVRLQRALLRGVPGQGDQLLRAAGGGQLLGGLQPEAGAPGGSRCCSDG